MVTPTTNPYTALIEWLDTTLRGTTKADFALVPAAPRALSERPNCWTTMVDRAEDPLRIRHRLMAGEWAHFTGLTLGSTVPDLTRSQWPMNCCGNRKVFEVDVPYRGPLNPTVARLPVVCTRGRGHTGRHAAGNGKHIVAVWGDRP